jgi:hypothetical protein
MTATLMTRHGVPAPADVAIQRTAKGAPYFTRRRSCSRCGGAGGSERWAHTGFTCYGCAGSGLGGDETVKLYTPEQVARLDATSAKRHAKLAAAHAVAQAQADVLPWLRATVEQIADRQGVPAVELSGFLPDMLHRADRLAHWSEAQAAAVHNAKAKMQAAAEARAASRHIGAEGDRLDLTVTVERISDYSRPCFNASWKNETVWIVTMRDTEGNALVSKGTRFRPKLGATLRIRATVAAHDEFRGEAQTVVARVQDVAEAAQRKAAEKAFKAQQAAEQAARDAAHAMAAGFQFHAPYCGDHRDGATCIRAGEWNVAMAVPEGDGWALYAHDDYAHGIQCGPKPGAAALATGATFAAIAAEALTRFAAQPTAIAA